MQLLLCKGKRYLFLIKRYIINALSAVQWNTHISLNTLSHSWTLWEACAFHILGTISSSEESTRRATLDAPLTTYVNSAARGAALYLQVETNPDLLRDRQAG